jgi:hypothetical protein
MLRSFGAKESLVKDLTCYWRNEELWEKAEYKIYGGRKDEVYESQESDRKR